MPDKVSKASTFKDSQGESSGPHAGKQPELLERTVEHLREHNADLVAQVQSLTKQQPVRHGGEHAQQLFEQALGRLSRPDVDLNRDNTDKDGKPQARIWCYGIRYACPAVPSAIQ